jgi:hypothetical protein
MYINKVHRPQWPDTNRGVWTEPGRARWGQAAGSVAACRETQVSVNQRCHHFFVHPREVIHNYKWNSVQGTAASEALCVRALLVLRLVVTLDSTRASSLSWLVLRPAWYFRCPDSRCLTSCNSINTSSRAGYLTAGRALSVSVFANCAKRRISKDHSVNTVC